MNNQTAPVKGITATIYRDGLGVDFSNGGISATVTEVTVVGPGIDPVFAPTQERPSVRIIKREGLSGPVCHAEPLPTEDLPAPWYMFGGAFIFSSDSRFRQAIGIYGRYRYTTAANKSPYGGRSFFGPVTAGGPPPVAGWRWWCRRRTANRTGPRREPGVARAASPCANLGENAGCL